MFEQSCIKEVICILGTPFIWNGIASEIYDISIMSINNNDWQKASGSDITFTTEQISRNPELLFLNAVQYPVLTFSLEFVYESKADVYKHMRVKDWLFGEIGYKKLRICMDGLQDLYFQCQLKPKNDFVFYGDYGGYACDVECSSSFAFENNKIKLFNHSGISSSHNFYNLSHDSEDLKPIITFTTAFGNRKFSITNESYNNLEFKWDDLQGGETIYCDCNTGIIKSSTGLRRIKNFNKQFLRLKKGLNLLHINGGADLVKFEYRNAKRLGGGF